jgi:hypothetical protein
MKPNKFTPQEQAAFLMQFSQDTFIVDYFLNQICEKFKFERFDDKAYWLDVRDEWQRLKTYE